MNWTVSKQVKTLVTALALAALGATSYAQPSANSKGQRKGWEIGKGNPNRPVMQFPTNYRTHTVDFSGLDVTGFYPSGLNTKSDVVGIAYTPDFTPAGYTILSGVTTFEPGEFYQYINDQGTFLTQSFGTWVMTKQGVRTTLPGGTVWSLEEDNSLLFQDFDPITGQSILKIWKDGVVTLPAAPLLVGGFPIDIYDRNTSGELLGFTVDNDNVIRIYVHRNGGAGWQQIPPLVGFYPYAYEGILLDNGAVLFNVIVNDPNHASSYGQVHIYENGAFRRLSAPDDPTAAKSYSIIDAKVDSSNRLHALGSVTNNDGGQPFSGFRFFVAGY
jgi:hypothetical protein